MRSFLIALLFTPFLFAESGIARELDLQADNIQYLEEGTQIAAEGNVVARFGNASVRAKYLSYTASTQMLEVRDGFVLEDPPYHITGEQLSYNIESREGEAWGVSTHFKDTHFAGEHLRLHPKYLGFQNAEYSSCPGTDIPRYKVTARAIDLDLEDGLVIARWGFFWLGRWPIFPIPAFIHSLGNILDLDRRKNISPFPTLGSNAEDGLYGFWSTSIQNVGPGRALVFLGYSERKAATGELQYSYTPRERMDWEGRIGGSQGDGLWGGLDVTLHAKGKKKEKKDNVPSLFAWEGLDQPLSQAFLRLSVTHRERINFERVSFRPMGELHARSVDWLFRGTQFDLAVHGGRMIEERSGLNLATVRFAPEAQYFFNASFGKPSARLAYDWRLYSNGAQWSQGWVGLLWELPPWQFLETDLEYSLPFHLRGGSPFFHETYRFFDSPFYGTKFRLNGYPWFTELEGQYNLPGNSPRERNVTIGYAVDCLEISLKWLSEQRLFQFGMNILSE